MPAGRRIEGNNQHMKQWKVTAELNMNARHYETILVKANTERKARLFAEEKFKKNGAFFVTNMTIEEVKDNGGGI